jgi:membrane protein
MIRSVWDVLKKAVTDFFNDDAMTQGAALAFYTALSFAPLLTLLIFAASFLPGDTKNQLVAQVSALVGPQAGDVVNTVANSSPPGRSRASWASRR